VKTPLGKDEHAFGIVLTQNITPDIISIIALQLCIPGKIMRSSSTFPVVRSFQQK